MTGPAGRDPGLQPERTRLAWRRTTLAFTVAAVLAVRLALLRGASPAALVAGCLVVSGWLGLLAVAHRRIRELDAARPPVLSGSRAATAAVCVVALAAFGAVPAG